MAKSLVGWDIISVLCSRQGLDSLKKRDVKGDVIRFIFNLFCNRPENQEGLPDVYQYDEIPEKLRVQVMHIVRGVLSDRGRRRLFSSPEVYLLILESCLAEFGAVRLWHGGHPFEEASPEQQVLNFIVRDENTKDTLSIIESSLRAIEQLGEEGRLGVRGTLEDSKALAREAVDSINFRFEQARVGYFYDSGMIRRKDSQATHQLAVKPALEVLRHKRFKGPNEEFLSAHEHYREGKYEDCLVNCCKAFESTMRIICDGGAFHLSCTRERLSVLGLSV